MRAVYDSEWGINVTGARVSKQAISILETASYWLLDRGVEIAIAGCTELSVGFASIATVALPWVDPLDVLASITLDLAFGHGRLDNSLNLCTDCDNVRKRYCCIFSLIANFNRLNYI